MLADSTSSKGTPLYINKWLTFMASAAVQLTAGVHYTFPVYADELKKVFKLSQLQIQGLGAAVMVGGSSGLLGGLVYDALEKYHRFGPRFTIACGAVMTCVGYIGLWLATTGHITVTFWHIVAILIIATNGLAWAEISTVVTNVRNFPAERGFVVGILKAYVGLSASVYSTLYSVVFSTTDDFLFFLGIAPAAVFLISCVLVNHVPYMQLSELQCGQDVFTTEGRFLYAYQVVGALALYQMVVTLMGDGISEDVRFALVFGMLFLVLPILWVSWGSGGLWSEALFEEDFYPDPDCSTPPSKLGPSHASPRNPTPDKPPTAHSQATSSGWGGVGVSFPNSPPRESPKFSSNLQSPQFSSNLQSPLLDGANSIPEESQLPDPALPFPIPLPSEFSIPAGRPGDRTATLFPPRHLKAVHRETIGLPELNPLQCLMSVDFLLLFFSLTCLTGSCTMFLNNLGQLVAALKGHHDSSVTPLCTSLYSVTNCLGRLFMGYVSEKALHNKAIPRPLFLIFAGLSGMAFTALAGFAGLPSLYFVAALGGLTYGASWSLMPALTSELFGLSYFATNVSIMALSPAVGTASLAMFLAGHNYDETSRAHGDPPNMCFGSDCFRSSFLVACGLCGAATVAALIITVRSRVVYNVEFMEVIAYDEQIEDDDVALHHYQNVQQDGTQRSASDSRDRIKSWGRRHRHRNRPTAAVTRTPGQGAADYTV